MSQATKAFADNLSDLVTASGKKVSVLAKEIGISAGSLSNYQNDGSSAGVDALIKISNYFGVSIDWLLGRSKTKSIHNELSQVCNYLGLSEDAVQVLVELKDSPSGYRSSVAEYILKNSRFFQETIEYLSACVWDSVEPGCIGYAPPSNKQIEDFNEMLKEDFKEGMKNDVDPGDPRKRLIKELGTETLFNLIDSNVFASQLSYPIINLGSEIHESLLFSQVIKTLTRLYDHFEQEYSEDKDFIDAIVRDYIDSYQPREETIRIPRRKVKTASGATNTKGGDKGNKH